MAFPFRRAHVGDRGRTGLWRRGRRSHGRPDRGRLWARRALRGGRRRQRNDGRDHRVLHLRASRPCQLYASCYGLEHHRLPQVPVDGGPTTADASSVVEAELDIEDVMGLAPGANLVVYEGPNTGGSVTNTGAYDTYAAAVNADAAQVITTSWGTCEASIDSSAVAAENLLFEQAALQGQTIIAASGDSGSEDCAGTLRGASATGLAVDDPAAQPFVTGVGGHDARNRTDTTPRSRLEQSRGELVQPGGGRRWSLGELADAALSARHAAKALGVRHGQRLAALCGKRPSGNCRKVPDALGRARAPRTRSTARWARRCAVAAVGQPSVARVRPHRPGQRSSPLRTRATACAVRPRPLGLINPALYAIASGPQLRDAVLRRRVREQRPHRNQRRRLPRHRRLRHGDWPRDADRRQRQRLGARGATLFPSRRELRSPPTSGLPRPVGQAHHPDERSLNAAARDRAYHRAPSSQRRGGGDVRCEGRHTAAVHDCLPDAHQRDRPARKRPRTPHGDDASRDEFPLPCRRVQLRRTTDCQPVGTPRRCRRRGRDRRRDRIRIHRCDRSRIRRRTSRGSAVRSPTRIVAVAPPGHSHVTVTVRSQSGRSTRVEGDTFTYST